MGLRDSRVGKIFEGWLVSFGAAHVQRPADVFGVATKGEQDMNGIVPGSPITLVSASGFKGVTFTVINLSTTAAANKDHFLVVSANNTAFNDLTTAGLRSIIPIDTADTLSFKGTPLPTQITFAMNSDPGAGAVTVAFTTGEE